ncbi:phosphoribosyltransferase family protein [Paraflavisolibacter sp. H34]|uniref:phosphoribosyltransferase n=1 Tax=Huijunlia imazamoxiresistens TaxID=3127457 RepID=UPI003015EFDD
MFANRKEAAIRLARALEAYRGSNVLVLGIPRGGAETGYYVADYLEGEFSLMVCRKLGHPANPEYAMGAIAEDGSLYLNPDALRGLSPGSIEEVKTREQKELQRRIRALRGGTPLPPLHGRTVILVDDGIATGATLFAAIRMCRNGKAARVVVAAPVAGAEQEADLARQADEVVILELPELYYAVSQAYGSFPEMQDEETVDFLNRWRNNHAEYRRQRKEGQ